jgi:hypothetical protein
MPIFAPFGFMQQPQATPVPPVWAPSDFANIQYWWRADLGVTESGTGVSAWRDQINNFDMIQGTDGSRPTATTSSNLNNQAVLSFNGTSDFLYTATTPQAVSGTDISMLIVYRIKKTSPGEGLIFGYSGIGAYTGRFFLDGVSANLRNYTQWASGASTTVVQSPMTTGNKSYYWNYDTSAGNEVYAYNTLSTTSKVSGGLTGRTNDPNLVVAVGATIVSVGSPTVFGGRYIEVESAENVVIYGTPTTDELNNWKAYVNNRYGTIIS